MDVKKLEDFYYGITIYGRMTYQFFGIIDFSELAASAVNLLIRRKDIYSWEKQEAFRFMLNKFIQDIGQTPNQAEMSIILERMNGITEIDQRLGGIEAAIRMSR